MQKSMFVAVLILTGVIWHACGMPSSRELEQKAQADQPKKDTMFVNTLASRTLYIYEIKADEGWYAAAVQSGLASEVTATNRGLIEQAIRSNVLNEHINIDNPQPGDRIYVPIGEYKTAKAVE